MSDPKDDPFLLRAANTTVLWASIVPLIAGSGHFIWQVYTWLKTGDWPSRSVGDVLAGWGFDLSGFYNPTDWVGVAKIGQWLLNLDFSSTAVVFGILLGGAYLWVLEKLGLS